MAFESIYRRYAAASPYDSLYLCTAIDVTIKLNKSPMLHANRDLMSAVDILPNLLLVLM